MSHATTAIYIRYLLTTELTYPRMKLWTQQSGMAGYSSTPPRHVDTLQLLSPHCICTEDTDTAVT